MAIDLLIIISPVTGAKLISSRPVSFSDDINIRRHSIRRLFVVVGKDRQVDRSRKRKSIYPQSIENFVYVFDSDIR